MDHALTAPFWALNQDAETTQGPERKPLRSSVFIHDAVTPWGRETMLLKLLRDQAVELDE